MKTSEEILQPIAERFVVGSVAKVEPFGEGAINATYLVTTHGSNGFCLQYVLQCLHEVFGPTVLDDMIHVGKCARAKGIIVPELLSTHDGESYICAEGGIWRMLAYIPGRSISSNASLKEIESAAGLLGKFHNALSDEPYEFKHKLRNYRDAAAYIDRLQDTYDAWKNSRRGVSVAALVEEALSMYHDIPVRLIDRLPKRIIHGDPKLSNFQFAVDRPHAVALLDPDTFMRRSIVLDTGDAIRSWCNPAGGNNLETARIDIERFEAFVRGYVTSASFLTVPEVDAMVDGALLMTVELAARYITDALEERYFRLDRTRYDTLFEQNHSRGSVQLKIAREIIERRGEMEDIVIRLHCMRGNHIDA